ncbi:MAG TPA: hypothetical protein PK760_05005 [Flavobacteriales bacterium]|nr:hypothetical protein [Flavobacteriales bacterium]
MKKHSILAVVAVLVTMAGCRNDEPVPPELGAPKLRVHVVPQWGADPLHLFTEYRAPGNYRFQVEMLEMYLSEIKLMGVSDTVQLADVRLLNLGAGNFDLDFEAPAGTWTGMRAGVGVSPDLNHSDPALYPNSNPLSVSTGMHWNWSQGYKFVLFDGRYDANPNSTTPLISGFSIHTGRDTCYKPMLLPAVLPFTTKKGEVTEVTWRVQVDEFLGTGSSTMNVTTENQGHGENVPLELKLTRNVTNSFHLE